MQWIMDDGVLVEILVRLPAKSLLRFKCVDRRWNSLISDPRFAEAQARNLTSQRIILGDASMGRISVSFEGLMNGRWEATRLDDVLHISCSCHGLTRVGPSLNISGSCHGLMCILHNGDRFVLCNPATMATRELPVQPFLHRPSLRIVQGFGYDALNDDYKLVIGNPLEGRRHTWDCHLFSLRSNSWRPIGELCANIKDCQGKYSDGFLHWLFYYEGTVSFDLANEQFHIDLLPAPVFTQPGVRFSKLAVTECGWLIISRSSPEALEFLIMKDPSNSTWTTLCCIKDEQVDLSSFRFWFPWVRNGKVFLCTVFIDEEERDYRIGLYDPDEGKYLKTVQVPENHCPIECYDSASHVLSLLSPHHV